LGKDKKDMTEMMWKEGDSILADRKDISGWQLYVSCETGNSTKFNEIKMALKKH
jgi:hypothetical protein